MLPFYWFVLCARLSMIFLHDLYFVFCFYHKYIFTYFKSIIPSFYVFALFINFIALAAIPRTMAKINALGKELRTIMILPLKNIFYSAITCLILMISLFSLPTTTILKLPKRRVFWSIEITLPWIGTKNLFTFGTFCNEERNLQHMIRRVIDLVVSHSF